MALTDKLDEWKPEIRYLSQALVTETIDGEVYVYRAHFGDSYGAPSNINAGNKPSISPAAWGEMVELKVMNLYRIEALRFDMLICAVVACEDEADVIELAGFEDDQEIEITVLARDVDLECALVCSETP